MDKRCGFPTSRILSAFAWLALTSVPVSGEQATFNHDIRPILAENCFACHGPDSAARQADLRFDRREAAVKAGAIVPHQPEESEMIRRVFSGDADERMPPPRAHKRLTTRQKEMLRQWIATGAEYQPLWSFLAPVRPPLPAVKNRSWVRGPIDRFVLAGLEDRGLQPAPEADRRTLARRLSLDITGLPPAPAVVEAFAADAAADAYQRLVDQLLAVAPLGRAPGPLLARRRPLRRHQRDSLRQLSGGVGVSRLGHSRPSTRNMPFDRFTVEQLAGDLLPAPTLQQQVATGFNRCNVTTNEGGVIDEEYLVLYTRDRTETTARVWMGLTAGCAVCHDHKFDPLSQKEFYQMSAFFNNTTQAAMDGNVKDTPPTLFLPAPQDRERWPALERELAEVKRRLPAGKKPPPPDLQQRLRALEQELRCRAIAGHGGARDAGARRDRPRRTCSFAASTTSGASRCKPATPAFLPPMPAELPQEPARPGPLAACAPSIR